MNNRAQLNKQRITNNWHELMRNIYITSVFIETGRNVIVSVLHRVKISL
jgi:hypothetical protein